MFFCKIFDENQLFKAQCAKRAIQLNFETRRANNTRHIKMFSIKHLIIFSAMVCVAYCYVGMIPSERGKSKTKEGFCEYNGEFIKQSESKINNECERIDCNTDFSIRING